MKRKDGRKDEIMTKDKENKFFLKLSKIMKLRHTWNWRKTWS